MTAQDRQRVKFETWVAENHPAAPLDRSPWQPDNYDGVLAAWTWAAWQAATTGTELLPEPVAGVCTFQPLAPGGRAMTHVALYCDLPPGTQLYTAEALATMDVQRTMPANAIAYATSTSRQTVSGAERPENA